MRARVDEVKAVTEELDAKIDGQKLQANKLQLEWQQEQEQMYVEVKARLQTEHQQWMRQ